MRRRALILLVGVCLAFARTTHAETSSQAELIERLRELEASQAKLKEHQTKLEANQTKLEELVKSKDAQLDQLKTELRAVQEPAHGSESAGAPMPAGTPPSKTTGALATAQEPAQERTPRYFGTYTPGNGFGLARTELGELTFSAYTYVRYLNQHGLDDTYTDGFGREVKVKRREDVQLQKVMLYFKGWLYDPRFRYLLYTWTANTSQGRPAQVVVAGNLTYAFDPALVVGLGIGGLPTVRSNEGAFPYLLTVDHRTLADEFFRGSYTTGIFATGKVLPTVSYLVMLGNNLSQLSVDAGQLDSDFTTVSTVVSWMPTTGEFGTRGAFGDYEQHEDVATRLAGHFTFSPEDRQSQPGTQDVENTQIRLSNGTVIFTPGALAPGVAIRDVKYYMADVDGGVKWRGFSFDAEYYLRWLNDFHANGPVPDSSLFDHGFQLQASTMVLPKVLQIYSQYSYVFGEFGEPWEIAAGVNWFPVGRRELRLNLEYLYDYRSPVGHFAIPQVRGATGSIFHTSLELFF